MKKVKRIRFLGFLISLFLLLMTTDVQAVTTPTLSLTGDSSVSPGSTVKYSIVINSTDSNSIITGFESQINYDSNVLTMSSIEPASGWTGSTGGVSSGGSINLTHAGFSNQRKVVATLVFKVKANVTSSSAYITLKTPGYKIKAEEGEDGNQETTMLSDLSLNLKIKSSDNTLSSLKVNGTSVKGFDSDILEYDVTVDGDVSSARIAATPNSSKASLKTGSGNRSVRLNYGSNKVNVTVISESGTEKTYTINITREDTRSTDATLSSITVDDEEIPDFKSNVYNYTLKKYKATSVKVVGIANDDKSKVKVNSPTTIVTGENTYTIVVTSEKGETATYTVVIDNVENEINKKLKNLSIKGYEIDFDRNNNRYEISYNKDKFKNLHIYYTTIASSDEVEAVMSPDINNDKEALKNLKVGDEITVTVTGIDGEKTEYTIVIVKDNRISFYLVLELFLMFIIVIVIIIIVIKRKKDKKKKMSKSNKNNYKTTKVVKKEEIDDDLSSNSAVEIVDDKKKRRRRFSIYEDEYEEVEVEVDDDDDTDNLSRTKEMTTEELNLK